MSGFKIRLVIRGGGFLKTRNAQYMIRINGRIAKITKRYNDYAWRLQFIDNKEIINVFYHKEETWESA